MLFFLWTYWGISCIYAIVEKKYSGRRTAHGVGSLFRVRLSRFVKPLLLILITIPSAKMFLVTYYHEYKGGFRGDYIDACSTCHSATIARSRIKPTQAWARTVERMAKKDADIVTPEKAQSVHQYLEATRSFSGDQLFQIKCLKCHDDQITRTPRTSDEWRKLVNRISQFDSFYFGRMQVENILEYIEGTSMVMEGRDSTEDPRENAIRLYEERCVKCHTLDIILLPELSKADWDAILQRMSAKAPKLISVEEATSLKLYVAEWRNDFKAFRHRIPHQSRDLFFIRGQ